jgi:hypothetical protein
MGLGIPRLGFSTARAHAIGETLLVDKPGTEQGVRMRLATIIALAKGD